MAANKELYVGLPKRQKLLLSKSVVRAVRSQSPPGRFLAKVDASGLYSDIGDLKAAEKTSQALREGAPDLRSKLKETSGAETAESAPRPDRYQSEEDGVPSESLSQSYSTGKTQFLDARENAAAITRIHPQAAYAEHSFDGVHHSTISESQSVLRHGTNWTNPASEPPVFNEAGFSCGSAILLDEEAHRSLERDSATPSSPHRVVNFDPSVAAPGQRRAGQNNDHVAPVDGGLEPAGLSTGTAMSMGTINTAILDEVPDIVDGGLEPSALSFGTAMSTTTAANQYLPKLDANAGATSFGSMMSFKPDVVDGGLEDIGTSFGSMSLNNEKRAPDEDFVVQAIQEEEPVSVAPPLLRQRKTKASLLADSDDSEDEDGGGESSSTVDWNRMQAAVFAAHHSQASGCRSYVSGGSTNLMPPPQHVQGGEPSNVPPGTMLNVPATQNLSWNVSAMTEVDPLEPVPLRPPKGTMNEVEALEASYLQGSQSYNLPPKAPNDER